MDTLEKAFWDYFIYLPQHVQKWQTAVTKKFPYLKALKNQLEQYRLVKSKKWYDENLLKKFPDIEKRTLEKIITGIEMEMNELRKLQSCLALLNRELFCKQEAILRNSKSIQIEEFTSKGTIVPPSWQLFELSENTKNYFAALYLQLDIAFCGLNYLDAGTISEFEDTILEISKIKNEIQDAIAVTTFCRDPS